MLHQARDRIGELDLAAHALRLVADLFEDARREHIAAGHAHARRCLFGCGLLHDLVDADQRAAGALALDDAVALGVLQRDFLHGQQRAPLLGESGRHLRHHAGAAGLAGHQVVGQYDGKGLVAHQGLGAQHGMAQAQRAWLAHKQAVHVVGRDAAHQREHLALAGVLQLVLQFVRGIEMVLDRALAAAGDEHHVADAGLVGLLDGVLDQGLVHHRQHLLGRCLGGGQEAGAEPRDGKDGLADTGGCVQVGCLTKKGAG